MRLAGITTVEAANAFLRERYLVEFNSKFAAPSREKGTAFRKTARADLNWIFTVQTERVVAKDNTVAMGEQCWQLEKSRFRSSWAGCTVTIHQHLEGTVSIRYGPHAVGRFPAQQESGGKDGTMATGETKSRFPPFPPALEIPPRHSHFPTAPTTIAVSHSGRKTRKPASASRRGTKGAVS